MGMMSWLAEQRIEEAKQKGEFDNLPGKGKPMELEDLSHIPEELRIPFKIMKNAGFVPEEVSLRKECVRLQDLISACSDQAERDKLKKA